MGGGSSKPNADPPKASPTTVTVPTTVPTTVCTPVHTSVTDPNTSNVSCWLENHEILYIFLALFSGILLTILVFSIIYLFRKRCQQSHQRFQGQDPSQAVPEESQKNIQNEVAYTTLVFKRSQAPVAV